MMRKEYLLLTFAIVASSLVFFYLPVIPAETVYVQHCDWYATRWVSISYALFGVGVTRWDKLCQ